MGFIQPAARAYVEFMFGLIDSNVPIRKALKDNAGVLSDIGLAVGTTGGAWGAATVWASSLGGFQSLMYAAGIASMPAWIPLAGALGGLTAGVFAVRVIRSKMSSLEKIEYFSLIYQIHSLVAHADGEVSELEKLELEKILVNASGVLNRNQLETIIKSTPLTVNDLKVPSTIDDKQRKMVIVACWQLALMDELNERKTELLDMLRLKLGISLSNDQLRKEAERNLEEEYKLSEALMYALRFATPEPFSLELTDHFLNELYKFNPKEDQALRRCEILDSATDIATIVGKIVQLIGSQDSRKSLVLKTYVLGRAILQDSSDKEALRQQCLELVKMLGLPLIDLVDSFDAIDETMHHPAFSLKSCPA